MKLLILTVAIIGTVNSVNVAQSYSIIHGPHHQQSSYSPFYSKPSFGGGGGYGQYQSFHDGGFGQSFFGPQSLVSSNSFGGSGQGGYGRGAQPAPPPKTCGIPPTSCNKSPFRTLNGACNNLQNPGIGMAAGSYSRLLTPKYGDGISSPTLSVTGDELPNARLISLTVFGERDIPDPKFTILNMQWGQILTHDMSLQFGGSQAMRHPTRCCTDEGLHIDKTLQDPTCYPITIPEIDPAHRQTNSVCMNFVRTLTDRDLRCQTGHFDQPAEQLTEVTAYLDLSNVYGNSEAQNTPIRTFQGGRLLTENRNGYEWPPSAANSTAACDPTARNEVCFVGGDSRINQNPGLTSLQIILLRNHNRMADYLQSINPHWDDERCFQEARRINIAQYQRINYYEWLPLFLGIKNMKNNGLIYFTSHGSYVNDYDSNIDPRIINSFATAAFRYFHTQIEGRLDLLSESRARTASLRLSDWFNRPIIVETEFDSLNRGMVTQPEELTDVNLDVEIKHFLFRSTQPFGLDLKALDIQRNRDHGLASYNDFREFCGLRRASKWEDFLDLITPDRLQKLQSVYVSIEDVDVTVGGALEAHVAGALAGPTFLCILTEQFFRSRVGDRYFFETGDFDHAFTREQLESIRQATVARLMCDNSNHIQTIQPRAFERINHDNQLIPCDQLPAIDLNLWKEEVSGHYGNSHNSYKSFIFKK